MTDKRLITIAVLLFLVSASFLAWRAERALDPDQGKDWWAVSFIEPHGSRGDLALENHGPSADFAVTLTAAGATLSSETYRLGRGESVVVPASAPPPFEVRVQRGSDIEDSQVLYKKF